MSVESTIRYYSALGNGENASAHAWRLLWGGPLSYRGALLAAIAEEGDNRGLAVERFYDPYRPSCLSAVALEGVGAIVTDPALIEQVEGLIDGAPPFMAVADPIHRALSAIAAKRRSAEREMDAFGRVLGDQRSLCLALAQRVVDLPGLRGRALRIARRLAAGESSAGEDRPVLQYTVTAVGTGYALPFGPSVRCLGLSSAYGLGGLFLQQLVEALEQLGLTYTRLIRAHTKETVGIYLPCAKVCYLIDAPQTVNCRPLAMGHHLRAHTTEERRAYRQLSTAADAAEGQMKRLSHTLIALQKEEDILIAPLWATNRLQNFRKRLLIDLFCKSGQITGCAMNT